MVAGGCAAIVGAGWAASPKELPSLDLVAPSSPESSAGAEASPSASASVGSSPSPSPSATEALDDDHDDDHEDEVEIEDEHEDGDDDDGDDAPVVAAPTETAAAEPDPVVTSAPAEPAQPASQSVDGPVVTNARGEFQARITVEGGTVTDVQAIRAGTQDAQSVQINARAIPILREEVLAAQSWDVAAVSGASFTSPGFLESVRGAFASAGL
ncbi:hypothetical protein SAMN05421637_2021 [Demequina mangrovi]|uniref:FMN-binding domain-containing protein n=2 Tax=Demequina mangrovi TaxID=1043493 RepID=A0A1H6ZE70_9MICO|nr:hypothetical protein SAMN05421637_2021 [Demequina mangrovi]